jgi:hypothetical protein
LYLNVVEFALNFVTVIPEPFIRGNDLLDLIDQFFN